MFIKFTKVKFKNFMSAGNTPIEIELSKVNKTLIRGANGRGKSVILHAITYALFGRAYAKINLASLVNDINGKESIVELEFEILSNKYKIVRGQKPKVFQIWKNDSLIEQSALNKDYQEYLENSIIKMTFTTYCQIIALGSMTYVPFLQLKAQDRRDFIEYILDLQFFTGINKILKDRITESKNALYAYDVNIASKRSSIKTLEDIIKWANDDVAKKSGELSDKIKLLLDGYNKSDSRLKELQESAKLLIVDDKDVQVAKVNIDKSNKLLTIKETEAEVLRKKIKYLETTNVCTTCNQPVDTSHRELHLKDYNKELSDIGEIILKIKSKLSNFEYEYDRLQKLLKDSLSLSKKIQDEEYSILSIKKEIRRLHDEKTTIESNKSNETIREKEDLLHKEKEELRLVEDSQKTELQLKAVRDIMQSALKDSGAKAEIIKTYIPIICGLVNKYLQKMNLFIKFELDENFNEVLKRRHRDEFTYESFSLGERCRIDFSLLFTWRELTKLRTGISSNLLFIDEIMEIGDSELFEVFLDIISSDKNLNCFVISHKNGLEVLFDEILNVDKVKGFTQIKLEH